jgi:UDP-N-acetylglucosamine--N-acetylmuramyl-(pentapeptide) pyrophosphoryl-undecaprenol N-acetylglucosamine transferase
MRFVITGGGTGGHVYPALAIAGGLKEKYPGAEILYMGSAKGLEADLAPRAGLGFEPIRVTGLKRRLTFDNMLTVWRASLSFAKALRVLADFKPKAVIGTGGYVCGPVVLAASVCRIPTLIHEQNALPGITNRLLAYVVTTVAITFPETAGRLPKHTRVILTGLPVRAEFGDCEKQKARRLLNLPENGSLVVSFGGSQGAKSINKAMPEVIKYFRNKADLHFLHITGPAQYDDFILELKQCFVDPDYGNNSIKPYLHEMHLALAAADLIVCRAGAATLAEITVIGKPAVLIPYPYASGNHQELNAISLKKSGAAVVIKDSYLTGKILAEQVGNLLADPIRLKEMSLASKKLGHPEALEKILECLDFII